MLLAMGEQRIHTTQAWRDGLFVGSHASQKPAALIWFAVGFVGVLLIGGIGLMVLAVNVLGAATSSEAIPTAQAEVIYLVVPGATASPPARSAAAARPTATTLAPARPAATARPPAGINGVPLSRIIVLSDAARRQVRSIFAKGQSLGRNAHAFAKVGDSTMVFPPFMAPFENTSGYRLGPFAYLQPTIAYYDGSFGRESGAAKKGMHTWTEFDPGWNNPDVCQSGETPLACELRLSNPSVVFVRLGANDVTAPLDFNQALRRITAFWITNGVIPVLGTKPDRQDANNSLNQMIRQTAAAYSAPLWDYDAVVGTIPGRGLEPDQIHLKGNGSHDYGSAEALQSGDSLEDLTALMMLDAIRRETQTGNK